MNSLWWASRRCVVLLAAFVGACGQGGTGAGGTDATGPATTGGSGGASTSVTGGDTAGQGGGGFGGSTGAGGAGGAPGTWTSTEGAGGAGGAPCDDECEAGPSCEFYETCVPGVADQVLVFEDVPCNTICPCCEGDACDAGTWSSCAPGSVCVTANWMGLPAADCLPLEQTCGGPDGLPCLPASFCDYGLIREEDYDWVMWSCDVPSTGAFGRCKLKPDPATCGPPDSNCCGCDGVIYANQCLREAAGVIWDRWGDSCP